MRVTNFIASQNIPDTNAQMVSVLEAQYDQMKILRTAREFFKVFRQPLVLGQLLQLQGIHQFINHPWIAFEDAGQIIAGRTKPDIQRQCGRVETEQLPQHSFCSERIAD